MRSLFFFCFFFFHLLVLELGIAPLQASEFFLSKVKVECGPTSICHYRKKSFLGMVGNYRSIVHLKDTLKALSTLGGFQSFRYSLFQEDGLYVLQIDFELKPIIGKIEHRLIYRGKKFDLGLNLAKAIPLQSDEFFDLDTAEKVCLDLEESLFSIGYPKNKVSFKTQTQNEHIDLIFEIDLGKPLLLKKIEINGNSLFLKDFLQRSFNQFYDKPFDKNKIKIHLNEIQTELFNYGYFLANLDFSFLSQKAGVIMNLKVSREDLFSFDLKNFKAEYRNVIHDLLKDLFRSYKRSISVQAMLQALKDHYQKKSYLDANFKVQVIQFKNHFKEQVTLYRIFAQENKKTIIDEIEFQGNKALKTSEIKKIFTQESFELASLKYFDQEYLNFFQEELKNHYVTMGYVSSRVYDPVIRKKNNQHVDIVFKIHEGQQTFIDKVEVKGVDSDLEKKVTSLFTNQAGRSFNPIQVPNDLNKVLTFLQDQGYYYAEILNSADKSLVVYNKNNTFVSIKMNVRLGPKMKLNKILFMGNVKTKKNFLLKKIDLQKNDLLSPQKLKNLENRLSATGLFYSVSAQPIRHDSIKSDTDLLVKVEERDFGLIEFAPGYRTDLGVKLSGLVSYQNIGGINRSLSLKSQLNRRTSFTTVDPERIQNLEHIIEHNTSVNLGQSDIFDTLIDGAASFSYQTRRFYAFDANIFRTNATLRRDFTQQFSSSLKYQYEDITQYGATDTLNEGSFQIGSLTGGLNLDLRNLQVNPTKGAYFNWSLEFANPYFFSQKQDDLTINYYKFLSRNRFYIPFSRGTIASSIVWGFQKNLVQNQFIFGQTGKKNGYIPTIKVFRLAGMDIVRGYTDEEMNRVVDGNDISEIRVDDLAYMLNFKLEPRFFLKDNIMVGLFYDAGRVFVQSMSLDELNQSVGLTFKFVTPVGTLDFDYGIKLLRKRDPSGRLEDPGRFHVSIGFF